MLNKDDLNNILYSSGESGGAGGLPTTPPPPLEMLKV